MKKFGYMTFMALFFLTFFCQNVAFAKDSDDDKYMNPIVGSVEVDDNGLIVYGEVYTNVYTNIVRYDLHYKITSDSGLYMLHKDGRYYIKNKDGNKFTVEGLYINQFDEDSGWQPYWSGVESVEMTSLSVFYDQLEPVTNLPIFEPESDALDNYLENGDTSGANNADELPERVERDASIEEPKELVADYKFSSFTYELQGDAFLQASWESLNYHWVMPKDVEKYRYDVEVSFRFSVTKNDTSYNGENDVWGGWISYIDKYTYPKTYDLNTGQEVVSDGSRHRLSFGKDTLKSLIKKTPGLADYGKYAVVVSGMKVRVRNRLDSKVSNWVEVTSTGQGSVANSTDENGNKTDGDYDNSDVDGDPSNSNKNFDVDENGDISLNGIMSYIRSGFGLLGTGGLLALMSGIFSYIPISIWTLIKTAIAISITIMVLSLVKRFAFG